MIVNNHTSYKLLKYLEASISKNAAFIHPPGYIYFFQSSNQTLQRHYIIEGGGVIKMQSYSVFNAREVEEKKDV